MSPILLRPALQGDHGILLGFQGGQPQEGVIKPRFEDGFLIGFTPGVVCYVIEPNSVELIHVSGFG